MRRALAVVVLILLSLVWAANAALQTAWVQARIRSEVRALVYELLNMTVDWARLEVNPLRLQVELHDFIAYSGANTDSTPFLQSPRITAAVSFTALLDRTLEIDPIIVERPIIRFGNDGDRWVNFLDIDKIDELASKPSTGKSAWSVVLRRVRLVDADIDFFVSSVDLRAHLTEFWAEGRFDELSKQRHIPIRARRGHGLYRMFGRDAEIASVEAELAVQIIKGPWVDLVIDRAVLRGAYPNATLRASGRVIDVARRHLFAMEGAGETELNFLNGMLFDAPRLTGTASYNVRYDGDFEKFTVRGDVRSDSFLWDDLPVADFAARAEVTEGRVKIVRSSFGVLGGNASLAGALDIPGLAWQADASLDAVQTDALRRWLPELPPLTGSFSLGLAAQGAITPAVTAAGRLHLTTPALAFGWNGATRIALRDGDLDSDFRWDGETLSVEGGQLTTAREQIGFSGAYSARGEGMDFLLSVQTGDLSVLDPIVGFDVEGWGTAEGRWGGSLREPLLEFNFQGRDVALPWFSTESAGGYIEVTLDRVTLADVVASAGEGSAELRQGTIAKLRDAPELDIFVEGRGVPLRPSLNPLLGDAVPIDGRFDGEFALTGPVTSPTGHVRGRLVDAVAWGEPLDEVEGEVGIERGNIELRELTGKAGAGNVRARGRVDFAAGQLDVELAGDDLDLRRSAHLAGTALGGAGAAQVRIFGSNTAPDIDAEFAVRGATAYTVALGDVRGRMTKRGDVVRAEAASAAGAATAVFRTTPGFPGSVTAAAPGLDLTPLVDRGLNGDIELLVGGRAEYRGPLADLARGEGELELAKIGFRQNRAVVRNDGTARFKLRGGDIVFERVVLVGSDTDGVVTGRAGLDGALDLRVAGGVELQFFTLFVDGLRSADGRLQVDGTVRGTLGAPQVTGTLKVRKGRLQLADVNLLFENVEADAVFSEGQIVIERMQSRLGAGTVVGGGVLAMDGFAPTNVSLFATLNEAEARIPQWLLVRANGRVEMVGPIDDVLLRGDLDVVQASYGERVDWESLILRFKPREAPPVGVAAQRGFHVDLGLHSAGSIFVRNNLADVKLRGDLQVKGYPPDLGVYGNLQVVAGSIFFRENVFSVESGQINFTDPERVRPLIDLRAKTRVEEATGTGVRRFDDISLDASGPPDNLQINLESSPPLSREDIISLLYIRRRTSEDIGASETAGSEAVSLAFKLNDDLAGFQSEVQQYFGFENLVLEPAFTDNTRSGTLKLRAEKILRNDLKATLSTSLSSADLDFWLGYAVTDNMLLDFGWNTVEELQEGSSNVGNFKIRPRLHFEFQ